MTTGKNSDQEEAAIVPAQPVLSGEEMRAVDRATIEERGIAGEKLMEDAGSAAWDVIRDYFQPARLLVLAGKGNNGGDGLVVARRAAEAGAKVELLLWTKPEELKGEALHHYEKLPEKQRPEKEATLDDLKAALEREPEVIVDAMLGIGVSGPLREPFDAIVPLVNAGGPAAAPRQRRWAVAAIDIPSGLSADLPWTGDDAVRADVTITFGAPKTAMVVQPGIGFTGRVLAKEIGFPRDLLDTPERRVRLLTSEHVGSLLPRRPADSHKGTFGTCFLFGGSVGFGGAPILMAQAALRSGVGLTFVGVPRALYTAALAAAPAALPKPLAAESDDLLDDSSFDAMAAEIEMVDVVAGGPGLGTGPRGRALVRRIVEGVNLPLILDADALTNLARIEGSSEMCRAREAPLALTPHPGEMARLLHKKSPKEIQDNRLEAAREAAERYGAYVVLKGAQTVIATPDGRFFINPTGNSGLAKGGSGDLLTGLLAGLAAQAMSFEQALCAGVFLHGLAADLATKEVPPEAMTCEDVLGRFGEAFRAAADATRQALMLEEFRATPAPKDRD